jgi:asparagine synthase (glutamine-hydrolysing)
MAGGLFRTHRGTLREMVLDGQLAQRGLIDRPAVEALLKEDAPFSGPDFHRLLEFAEVEAWAANWG